MEANSFSLNSMLNLEQRFMEKKFGDGEKEEEFGDIAQENTPFGTKITEEGK